MTTKREAAQHRLAAPTRDDRVSTMIFSLLGCGFFVETVRTAPGYTSVECIRSDEFGVPARYYFVLPLEALHTASANAVSRRARQLGAQCVVIGDESPGNLPSIDWPTFQAKLGGPVKSWLPLEPTFAASLSTLGHNQPIEGIEGRPDALFEEYVHVALQFVMGNRVVRYGQERRGEERPDGIGMGEVLFLYDAKAYADGYPVDVDAIRQFGSYVAQFDRKYGTYLGRIHSFLVISGHFNGDLEERSSQMYSEHGVRLVFLTADDLGDIVNLLKVRVGLRGTLDWRRILSRTRVTVNHVEKELKATRRDRVVRSQS